MAQRATIPHIFTQWEPGQFSRPACGLERIDSGKKTDDFRRPSPSTRKQYFKLDYVSPATPSGQSLMLTPESNRWAFESCRNLRKSPSELSAVDSIFELPSGDPDESPASSTHSSFVAELEDTSPVAIHSKRSAFPGSQLAFQSSAITSRAVIKAIDETIASIEADNRKLLTRAVTAEHTVKVLKEQNSSLQLKIDLCDRHHRRNPRAVSSQPTLRRQRLQQSPGTPRKDSNDTIDGQSISGNVMTHTTPPSQAQPSERHNTPPSTPPNRPLPSPTRRTSRPVPTKAPPRIPIQYNLMPKTPSPTFPAQIISSPIPGSVYKHPVTHLGTPLSLTPQAPIISLADAQAKMKPLPPISPGALHGNVQIGLGLDGNDLEKKMSKRKKGFSVLFKKGKKMSVSA